MENIKSYTKLLTHIIYFEKEDTAVFLIFS